MVRRWLPLVLFALIGLCASCTADSENGPSEAAPVASDAAPTAPSATASPEPTPAPPPEPVPTPQPTVEGLGRYLVARPDAGVRWQGNGGADRVIPVFDEPGGERRHLLEVNAIDGVVHVLPLFNWSSSGSPTVLRVVEGEPGDEWIKVQAPTRPHDATVWVDANDWAWAETDLRVEIDLSGPGVLTVHDGDEELFEAPIVQGRDSRPTPEHVTFIEAGALTAVAPRIPAYGDAVLTMASFSEVLGTFGGGNSPRNFLHGTNQPDLMGQRVSSGEIRLTNPDLARVIELVHPGVPVLLFDGQGGRHRILERATEPAPTINFVVNVDYSIAAERHHPQLWIPCNEPTLVCGNPEPDRVLAERSFRYAIVRDLDSTEQIPVFDAPGGEPRTLIDRNDIDGVELLNPLYPITVYGEPLVLRVLEEQPDWLRVQVATRPNQSTVWVRSSDFHLRVTDVFIEIALAPTGPGIREQAGELLLYNGEQLLAQTTIVSGRESRPTPLVSGWVTQIVKGSKLGPAYGDWVLGLGTLSEALGTFGGGGAPGMAIHGTNQPDLMGQRVSSGTVRVIDEVLDVLVETPGVLGAPAFIHDKRPYLDIIAAREFQLATQPALTAPFDPDAEQIVFTGAGA